MNRESVVLRPLMCGVLTKRLYSEFGETEPQFLEIWELLSAELPFSDITVGNVALSF